MAVSEYLVPCAAVVFRFLNDKWAGGNGFLGTLDVAVIACVSSFRDIVAAGLILTFKEHLQQIYFFLIFLIFYN